MKKSVLSFAFGRVIISGEWAVLDPRNFAILMPVKKRVFVRVKKSPNEKIFIFLKDFNLKKGAIFFKKKLKFLENLKRKEKEILRYPKKSIEMALNFLGKFCPFQLEVWGEIKEKVGFGFSGACSVAIISALLKFHQKKIKKEELFKLAFLAHFLAQNKRGSGTEIATAVYNSPLIYRKPDTEWLKEKLKSQREIKNIVFEEWKNLKIEKIHFLRGLYILAGWTGKPAFTFKLIKKFQDWRKKNPKEAQKIILKIGKITKKIIKAWKLKNKKKILELIKKNREYLRELGEKSSLKIETEKLKKMIDIAQNLGAGAKISGAGGGDCVIALVFDKKIALKIKKEWEKIGKLVEFY